MGRIGFDPHSFIFLSRHNPNSICKHELSTQTYFIKNTCPIFTHLKFLNLVDYWNVGCLCAKPAWPIYMKIRCIWLSTGPAIWHDTTNRHEYDTKLADLGHKRVYPFILVRRAGRVSPVGDPPYTIIIIIIF
jgi:hypothetical protein